MFPKYISVNAFTSVQYLLQKIKMKKVCLLLLAFELVAHALGKIERLVGADNAKIGEFPYQVSLRFNGNHFCGAALITQKHVLTAAHCVAAATKMSLSGDITAVVGTNSLTSGGQTYKVQDMSMHPDYVDNNTPDMKYDIGVLTLSTEVVLSDLVALVKLPTKNAEVGSEAIVSGWGTMVNPYTPPSERLQKLTVKLIDLVTCQAEMASFTNIDSTQICTFVRKGAGLCSGDSGGPLSQDGVVIGLVSGGVPCAKGYPDVFTNVYEYLSYVNGITGQ